eukprot:11524421-Alexandrium_andersonii.AAC.1
MSASLVGSEMCIRDSVRLARTASNGMNQPLRDARDLTKVLLADPDKAVSYTHLTLPTICSV